MSTLFTADHRQDLTEWDDTAGSVAWDPLGGLGGALGGVKVSQDANPATLTADFDDITTLFIQARIYLAQRTLGMETGDAIRIAAFYRNAGADLAASLDLDKTSSGFALTMTLIDDNATEKPSAVALPDPWPAFLEWRFTRALGASANNGTMELFFGSNAATAKILGSLDLFTTFDWDRFVVGKIEIGSGTPTGYMHIGPVTVTAGNTQTRIGAFIPDHHTLRVSAGIEPRYLPGTTYIWETRLSNVGAWSPVRIAGLMTSPAAASLLKASSRYLLDTAQASIWQVAVDDSVVHSPFITLTDTGTLNRPHARELTLHADNGQEYSVTIDASGNPVFTALSSQWPVLGAPVWVVGNQWRTLKVTDGGVLFGALIAPNALPAQDCWLRAQDNSVAYEVTLDDNLAVVVTEHAIDRDHLYYDSEVVSANGTRYRIQVDVAGTLSTFNVDSFDQGRPGNTVALDSHGKLVVIDPRFKRASAHKSGWGWNRRTFRGGRA